MDATAVRGDDGGTGSGVVGTSVGGYGTYGSGYNAGVYGTGLHYGVVGAGTGIKDGFGVYGIGADNSATPAIAGGPGVVGAGGAGDTGGVGGVFTPGIYTGTSCAGYCGNDAVVAFGYPPTIGYGYAGNFNGDLNVKGSIYAGGKDFKIDHPLDPANKYLFHASVESSEMMNIYTGNVTTDGQGDATVALPEWFEALNTDFRYQVTVIGQFAQAIVAHKMENNQFTIKTSTPNVEVSWQVTGVRQDAFAKAHPLVVEQDKELPVKGFYIHPDLFGAPQEKQIEWARHPQLMKQLREIREKQAVHLRTAAK